MTQWREFNTKTEWANKTQNVKPDRCGLMFLHQEALTSLHNGGIRAHEGHRVLLDLIAEEQRSPINAQTHVEKHMT